MNCEELAVIIFEECASKTRTTKECVDGIKLRTNLTCDIDDTIRRFRQSGSGLEKAAKEVMALADTCGCNPTEAVGDCRIICNNGLTAGAVTTLQTTVTEYDTYLAVFNQKSFTMPEMAAKICVELKRKGVAFDLHTIEEQDDSNYTCETGIKVGESLYLLTSLDGMREYAAENRAESIANSAWEIARDEVNDMDISDLLEYSHFYDGVKSYDEVVSDSDALLIELDA